jgi:hypothetical protein
MKREEAENNTIVEERKLLKYENGRCRATKACLNW